MHGRGSVARKTIGTNVYDTSTPNVKATEICSFLGINSNQVFSVTLFENQEYK